MEVAVSVKIDHLADLLSCLMFSLVQRLGWLDDGLLQVESLVKLKAMFWIGPDLIFLCPVPVCQSKDVG